MTYVLTLLDGTLVAAGHGPEQLQRLENLAKVYAGMGTKCRLIWFRDLKIHDSVILG